MAEPWINWNWLKVGPLLTSEEDRVAYERRREEERANEGGIATLRRDKKVAAREALRNQQAIQFEEERRRAMAQRGAREKVAMRPLPDDPNEWNFSERLGAQFNQEQYERMMEADQKRLDETAPMQTIIPGGIPESNPEIIRRAREGNEGITPESFPAPEEPTMLEPVEVPATVDPQTQMIEDLKRQKAIIDQIYPQRPVDQSAYQQADEYALAERDRAKQLAQLAFFSAVAHGAGGSWTGVGQGLAAAGKVYSEGFSRYQTALENKAKRMIDQREQQYADDIKRSDAAVKLYEGEQERKKGQMSEARQALKERMDNIDTYFKERIKIANGNEFAPPNPSLADRLFEEWRVSRERGEIVTLDDVPKGN